jgi:YjbE family integral membrane protein
LDSVLTFLEIMLINVLLSGDNAIVIAMASQQLPQHQRKRAIWWGTAAAIALRCLLTLAAVTLLSIPYLQAIGAVLLYSIAIKLLLDSAGDGEGHHVRKSATLFAAIQTIVMADFVMSLDNVLAIAAVAEGDFILILLGIMLSIPLIIWGSHAVSTLLRRFPQLTYVGAALLGYAAGKMLVHDPGRDRLLFQGAPTLAEAIPVLSIPLVILLFLLMRRTN